MRLRLLAWEWFATLSQLLQFAIFGTVYLIGCGDMPNRDETLSSRVGRSAVKGERWALFAERLIDGVMGAGHCRRNIGT